MTSDLTLLDDFREFIHEASFPCVGAKSALAKGTLDILLARDLRSNWDDRRIYDGLNKTIEAYRKDSTERRGPDQLALLSSTRTAR